VGDVVALALTNIFDEVVNGINTRDLWMRDFLKWCVFADV